MTIERKILAKLEGLEPDRSGPVTLVATLIVDAGGIVDTSRERTSDQH